MTSARAACWVLAGCNVFWGLSFVLMPEAMASVERLVQAPAFALGGAVNAWRYLAALLVMLALAGSRLRGLGRRELAGGAVVGAWVGVGMILQIVGLRWVQPSTAAFITSLTVLFAPVAQWLIQGRPVVRPVVLAVPLALIGVAVLAWRPTVAAAGSLVVPAPFPGAGELCILGSALCFTGHILAVDHWCAGREPRTLAVVMFATMALINLIAAGASGGAAVLADPTLLAALAGDLRFVFAFAGLVIPCSVVVLLAMNCWQPLVPPAAAAVIYCLEPVFATAFSVSLGQERLALATLAGGALVIAATLVAARGAGHGPGA